jgi:hypothetical protein
MSLKVIALDVHPRTNRMLVTPNGIERDMTELKNRLAQDEESNADLQGDFKVLTNKLQNHSRSAHEGACRNREGR